MKPRPPVAPTEDDAPASDVPSTDEGKPDEETPTNGETTPEDGTSGTASDPTTTVDGSDSTQK